MVKPSTKTPHTTQEKNLYASRYLKRETIRHQRSVGVTESLLSRLKEVVTLIGQNNTTVRSYASAIIREHLCDYRHIHEYIRRCLYRQNTSDDADVYQNPTEVYFNKYLGKNAKYRNSVSIHVDFECARLLGVIVQWADTGATIGSFASAILEEHLDKYSSLLNEMGSDIYKCQLL